MTTKAALKNTSNRLIIRDYLLSLIQQNELNQQSKLPAERELCERFGITRITLRQALLQLETEGLIYRQHHKGWFVSPPRILYDPTQNLSFTEFVSQQHRQPHNRILSAQKLVATQWMKEALQLKEDETEVFFIQRLRKVDGRAVMLEHLYINASRCAGLLDCSIETSVTQVLKQQYDIVISRSSVRLHSTALTQAQAKELNGAAGAPSIYVIRTNYDQEGRIIEVDEEFWRHDALEISVNSELTVEEHQQHKADSGLSQLLGDYKQLVKRYENNAEGLSKQLELYRAQSQQEIADLKARLKQP
jgi:DNA-binding GntR family transcriptional regulator